MKKIITHLTLFTLAVVILSSCSNSHGISIAKRHYRSGYYVDFGSRSHTNTAVASAAKAPVSVKHKITPVEMVNTESFVTMKAPVVAFENPAMASRIAVPNNKQSANHAILNSTAAEQPTFNLTTRNNNDVLGSAGSGRRDEVSVPFVVIVLCAIFIPPLGVGLMYGINSYFWIDLILTLLFFFPGMIFALIVVLM